MRLADFILSNVEPIVAEWEVFARGLDAGKELDQLALRDHAGHILQATARDMNPAQTPAERAEKSKGHRHHAGDGDALDGASDLHAVDRLNLGFDLLEVMSEYRALRASVLQLWEESSPGPDDRNVAELTRFNESIDQSLARAAASYTRRVDQARDMFLAILGHDLRNPLSAISMSAHILPRVMNNQIETIECGLRIARSVSVMERMISDLLDYTRTRLGAGMPVTPAPLDLGELADGLIDEYRAAFPDREIGISCVGDLNGLWDRDRVRQAMSNVMGNALQHGAADVPVSMQVTGEHQNVSISIHNGGPPISPGELPNIFNPLVRGSSAAHPKANRPGSIGMGLYIAREVAKSHGGRIDVMSTAEEGTTFTIRLPRESAPRVGQPILDADHIRKM
jgi:signal transduction histidine kinase